MMPTEQTAQVLNNLVAAPINNLIVVWAIAIVLSVIGGGLIFWRVFKYLSNNDSPLVKVLREVRDAFKELKTAQVEKTAQVLIATNKTNELLVEQTGVLDAMGKTFSDHQITTHDTVANLSDKVDSLERSIDDLKRVVGDLDTTVKGLSNCDKMIDQLEKWKVEIITEVKEQAKRDTSTNVAVVLPSANVLPDTGAAGQVAA